MIGRGPTYRGISFCNTIQIPDHVNRDAQTLSIRNSLEIQPLKTHYYTFGWPFLAYKPVIEITFNSSCRMENNHVSVNISDIAGLGNIIRWQKLEQQYMIVYCFNQAAYTGNAE